MELSPHLPSKQEEEGSVRACRRRRQETEPLLGARLRRPLCAALVLPRTVEEERARGIVY
jgi:hypothetical protein